VSPRPISYSAIAEHSKRVTVTPMVSSGGLATLDGAAVDSVSLDPYGVAVLLRRA
jgi:hypothetical protein